MTDGKLLSIIIGGADGEEAEEIFVALTKCSVHYQQRPLLSPTDPCTYKNYQKVTLVYDRQHLTYSAGSTSATYNMADLIFGYQIEEGTDEHQYCLVYLYFVDGKYIIVGVSCSWDGYSLLMSLQEYAPHMAYGYLPTYIGSAKSGLHTIKRIV